MKHPILTANGARLEISTDKWQYRLDEVQYADTPTLKGIARQHLSRAIDQFLPGVPKAANKLLKHANLANFVKCNYWNADAREEAECMFGSFILMRRLLPGIEALKMLSGGKLPRRFRAYVAEVWAILAKVEALRLTFYATRPSKRLTAESIGSVLGLHAELETLLKKILNDARVTFDLESIYREPIPADERAPALLVSDRGIGSEAPIPDLPRLQDGVA